MSEQQSADDLTPQVEAAKRKKPLVSPLALFLFLGMALLLASILVPNYMRAKARKYMTACKSNIKNIGTAMDMYASDHEGHYPTTLSDLTPNYLKTIPACSSTGEVTYRVQIGEVAYNTTGLEDYFFLQCEGENHTNFSLPPNYPQYDSVSGLFER